MSSLQWVRSFAFFAIVCAVADSTKMTPTEPSSYFSNKDAVEADRFVSLKEMPKAENYVAANSNKISLFGLNGTEDDGKILGGAPVASGMYNFNVLVEATGATGTKTYCGGAILSTTWIITAAQCVATSACTAVYSGAVEDPIAKGFKTAAIPYIHPGFKRNCLLNDIALIRLLVPLKLAATIGTIRLLGSSVSDWNNVAVRTFGFGSDEKASTLPVLPLLHSVDSAVLTRAQCLALTEETYVSYPFNTGCLATSLGTKGICFADAGGPVIYINDSDESERVVGINSQYLDCPSYYPSSFTLIEPYIPWIKSITLKTFT